MKLFSSDIEKRFKESIKGMRDKIIFPLILVTVMNGASVYAINSNKTSDNDNETSMAQVNSIEDDDMSNVSQVNSVKNANSNNQYIKLMQNIKSAYVSDNNSYKYMNEYNTEKVTNTVETDNLDIEEIKVYSDLASQDLPKKYLVSAMFDNSITNKELSGVDYFYDNKNEKSDEITINNFDTASIEKKMEFICDKYNLTDYELKVIISVVYHEAGWYYDDAFKVATVIYNRTKSKECIRYIHNLTNLDGESLYAQVIATSYTSEGNKVQQFDGYLPKQAGYDYDSLLAESQAAQDYDLVKLNGLLDCLILLKLGEDYENPTFPLAPVFSKIYFYGDGCRNHFSGPISSSDVVDNYNFPYEEYEGEFTREDVINMAKEYVISSKKRVK